MNSVLAWDYIARTILKNAVCLGAAAGLLGAFLNVCGKRAVPWTISSGAYVGALVCLLSGIAFRPGLSTLLAAFAALLLLCVVRTCKTILGLSYGLLHALTASVFFGAAMALDGYVSRKSGAAAYSANRLIFGEGTPLPSEIEVTTIICLICVAIAVIGLKRFQAVFFNGDLASTTGIPAGFYDLLATVMTALVIAAGLRTIGVIFMSALILLPAAAAFLNARSFAVGTLIAGFFGALSAATGGVVAGTIKSVSAGPASALAASLIFLVCLLLRFAANFYERKLR